MMISDTSSAAVALRWDLRPGDLGRVLSLHGILYAAEFGFDHTFEGYVAGTLAHFAEPVDAARERLWLAEDGSRLVGCVAILKHAPDTAQLRWLLIDPLYRGRGLGRRLVQDAVAFARAAGYALLFLETDRELPVAGALYRAVGFTLVHEEPRLLWGRALMDQRYELRWPRTTEQ